MTSHTASDTIASAGEAPHQPLRLQLSGSRGHSPLDGSWWPQTRDLDIELADQVDHLPVHVDRLTAAQVLFTSVGFDIEDHALTDQRSDAGGNWWQGASAPSFRSHATQPAGAEHPPNGRRTR